MANGRRFTEADLVELEDLLFPFLRTATKAEQAAAHAASGRLMKAQTDEESEAAWAALKRLLAREADGGLE
jgi:hypothetical protein